MFPFSDDVPSQRMPVVTVAIIVLNALAFLYINRLPDESQRLFVVEHGFIPARLSELPQGRAIELDLDALSGESHLHSPFAIHKRVRLPAAPRQILLTLVTSLFLHGGWMHLIGNMWFFWIFGDNVEDRLGHGPFLVFYLAGGVFASLCHWLSGPASGVPVIGASGAVAAILGAYAITWPLARIRCLVLLVVIVTMIELPALVVLGFWFLTQLLEASRQTQLGVDGGVAFWAHVGGFVAGMIAMPLLRGPAPPRREYVTPPPEMRL
ncbi:MAG TPA: rhomboid family intramembrane serine protease [Pirellulales bacterium]|nr:rhomboid family intramembrane serine protease [Pirellulales bacterium]